MRKIHCKCGRVKERRSAGHCNKCHSAYTKQWKLDHPLTSAQKEKDKLVRRKRDLLRLEGKRKRSPRLGAKPGILRPLCSWCDAVIENFKKKNYCKKCSAKYNREWRKKNLPSEDQRFKDNVRVKTYYAIKAGKLIRKPCEVCGEAKVEAHHDDYNKTYDVRWLCGKHHREHHMLERKSNGPNSKDNQ
jgi:ribosomal protein S27AE